MLLRVRKQLRHLHPTVTEQRDLLLEGCPRDESPIFTLLLALVWSPPGGKLPCFLASDVALIETVSFCCLALSRLRTVGFIPGCLLPLEIVRVKHKTKKKELKEAKMLRRGLFSVQPHCVVRLHLDSQLCWKHTAINIIVFMKCDGFAEEKSRRLLRSFNPLNVIAASQELTQAVFYYAFNHSGLESDKVKCRNGKWRSM